MRLSFTLNFSPAPQPPPPEPEPLITLPPPPAGWTYARALHDDEAHDKDRLGLPETVSMVESHWVTLNEAWQNYLFGLMQSHVPTWPRDDVVRAWASYTKDELCYTDGHAVQNGAADFIQGENLESGGIGWRTLTTGGNILLVKQQAEWKGGDLCHEVWTLNGRMNPPNPNEVNYRKTPWLIGASTTRAIVTLPDGRHRVNPFPQLGGADVPALVISNRTNYIRARHIVLVTVWETPYVR